MKYVIEFDLPDNDTVLNNIKTAWVGWNVWGYSGITHAKLKQPERKTGKWEKDTKTGRWRCSECYAFALKTDDGRESLSDYCPVCGVKMKEGEQDAERTS